MAITKEQALEELARRGIDTSGFKLEQPSRQSKISKEEATRELARRGVDISSLQKSTQDSAAPGMMEELKRQGLRTARTGLAGLSAVGDLANTIVNPFLELAGQKPLKMPSEIVKDTFDVQTNGLTAPRNLTEKAQDTAGEFVASTINPLGALRGVSNKAAQSIGEVFKAPKNITELNQAALAGGGVEAAQAIAPNSNIAPLIGSIVGHKAATPLQTSGATLGKAFGVNPEAVDTFNNTDLNPTLADVSNGKFAKYFQNLLHQLPLAGHPIQDAIENTQNKISSFIKNNIGEGLGQSAGGDLALKGLKSYEEKAESLFNKMDKRLEKFVPNNTKMPINNTLNFISEDISQFQNPTLMEGYLNSPIGDIYKKFILAAKQPTGISRLELRELRRDVDSKISNFGLNGLNAEEGKLKLLRGQMKEDLREAFKLKGSEALKEYDKFNKLYSSYADKVENVINKIKKKKYAIDVFRDIISNNKVDARKAEQVYKGLTPDEKKVFGATLIRNLGETTQNEFNLNTLATNYKKLEPEARKIVLSPFDKETSRDFETIINAIDYTKATAAQANSSKSGYYNILFGSSAVFTGNALPAAQALTGGYISSKLITNKPFVNWLGHTVKSHDEMQLKKAIAKLPAIVRASPGIADDIEHFIHSINPSADKERKVPQITIRNINK